jgi:hypothetical protein
MVKCIGCEDFAASSYPRNKIENLIKTRVSDCCVDDFAAGKATILEANNRRPLSIAGEDGSG